MSAVRTERLLNLFIALSSTERGMTRQQLREAIPAYAATASEAAFERSFERDKEELRALGTQLVTADGPVGSADATYRVVPQDMGATSEEFTPSEVGVALVAARVFDGTAMQQLAERAAMKLRARASATHSPVGVAVSWAEDLTALGSLAEAVTQRQQVALEYPASGGGVAERVIDPWVLRTRHGRWYVTGWCHTREAHRTFRVSRCVGPVRVVSEPGAFELPEVMPDLVWENDDPHQEVRARLVSGGAEEFCVKWGVVADGAVHVVGQDRLAAYGVRALVQDAAVAGGVLLEPEDLQGQVDRVRRDVAATHAGEGMAPPVDWVAQVRAVADVGGWAPDDGAVSAGRVRKGGGMPDPDGVARVGGRGPGADLVGSGQAGSAGGSAASQARKSVKRADAGDRLRRLLAMVPYTVDRPGVELAELAEQFGISKAQAVKDLELLFVCGRPGYYPDDLIEACWDDDVVFVGNAEEISTPLPLTPREAGALRVGLGALVEAMPEENAAVESVLRKLGGDPGEVPEPAAVPFIAGLRRAVRDGVQVVVLYWTQRTQEALERRIDPWHVVASNGFWYLQGWCHTRGAARTFRLDRMRSVEVTGDPVSKRAPGAPNLLISATAPGDPWAVLAVRPEARWVTEQPGTVLLQSGDETGAGRVLVAVQYADPQWLTDLVLRLGGAAEVLHPTSLREVVQARALAKSPPGEVIHS